jgi:hypothetical protein
LYSVRIYFLQSKTQLDCKNDYSVGLLAVRVKKNAIINSMENETLFVNLPKEEVDNTVRSLEMIRCSSAPRKLLVYSEIKIYMSVHIIKLFDVMTPLMR